VWLVWKRIEVGFERIAGRSQPHRRELIRLGEYGNNRSATSSGPASGTGVLFVPTIGCNFSPSAAQNFPITVTLTVTDALGARASFSDPAVIGVRLAGECGVPPATTSRR
jgi:hypothetical protein